MLTGKFVVSGCFTAILGLLAGPALAQTAQSSLGGVEGTEAAIPFPIGVSSKAP